MLNALVMPRLTLAGVRLFASSVPMLLLSTLVASAAGSPGHRRGRHLSLERGAVPSGGKCINEGSHAMGNHCAKLTGAELDKFMTATTQTNV